MSGGTMTNLNQLTTVRLSADATATTNGDGAKSAKVTLVARTGGVVDLPWMGPTIHDFAGLTVPNRIPLDWAHDPEDSIGYLNRFDTSTGELVCSGAIVIADAETAALVQKMSAGVPYQASIEHGLDDCVMEFVPDGASTQVNGQSVNGPVTVVRQWELDAVAICKFGADSDTSATVQMSSSKKNHEAGKGFFIRFSNQRGMKMDDTNVEPAKVEMTVAVEAPVETAPVAVVEPDAKAVKADEQKDVTAETPVVVEAEKVEPVATPAVEQVQMTAVTADPRSEFKLFMSAFGPAKAGTYFAEGLSMSAATLRFAQELKAENDDLRKRLAALDRGAEKPVKMSKASATADEKPAGPLNFIRIAGSK